MTGMVVIVDKIVPNKNVIGTVQDVNCAMISTGFLARILTSKAGSITKKQRDYLEIANDNLSKIDDMIQSFLVFSRFESKASFDMFFQLSKIFLILGLEFAIKPAKLLA